MAQKSKKIDFCDMVYLPVALGLSNGTYQWVLVDEAQDLSAAQLALVIKLRAKGGRMIFVGDPYQSIFGFAGADTQSFQKIIDTIKPTELPLSVCYRCPTTHLDLAKTLVPHIVPSESAIPGIVQDVDPDDLVKAIKEGDMVLCRKNAPLLKVCFALIANKIPARMRGHEIGKELANLAEKIYTASGLDFSQFGSAVNDYTARAIAKLAEKSGNDKKIETLQDKAAALIACFDGFNVDTIDKLENEIKSLFTDDRSSVILSSVHRAKGLENNRVFILNPEFLPLTWKNQTAEDKQQELNLYYVALTRAKQELFFVRKPQHTETKTA